MPIDPKTLAEVRKCVTDAATDLGKALLPSPCSQLDDAILHELHFLAQLDSWLSTLIANPGAFGPHPCQHCPSWKPPTSP